MLQYISVVRSRGVLSTELAAVEVDCWKDLAQLDPSCAEVLLLAEHLLHKGRKLFAVIKVDVSFVHGIIAVHFDVDTVVRVLFAVKMFSWMSQTAKINRKNFFCGE